MTWPPAHTFLIQPSTEVEGVVGEEPLVVQGVAQQLRHGSHAHGPPVRELVLDPPLLDHLVQRPRVCLEAGRD